MVISVVFKVCKTFCIFVQIYEINSNNYFMGSSTEYYRKNAEARKKKAATDKKINARPSQIKKRVESNSARAKAKAAGKNVTGKDYDHAVGKFVSSKTNRGRAGEGGRKKK